jgi:hypothetical protein
MVEISALAGLGLDDRRETATGWHCQLIWRWVEFARETELACPHAALWANVSCRQIRKALVRVRRY